MLYIKRIMRQRIPLLLICLFLFFYASLCFPQNIVNRYYEPNIENTNFAFSQVQNDSSQVHNFKFFFKTTVEDFRYIATSSLRMSRTDGLKLSALSATTVGLVFYLDEQIDEEFTSNEDTFPYVIGHKFAYLGEEYGRKDNRVFYLFGGLSASMLTGGLLLDDPKLLKTTGLMTESFVFTSLIMGSVKMVLGRTRPYAEKGSTDFDFLAFSQNRDLRSMPSGHTSSAFAMMTVIAKQYNYWWIEIPAYVFATGAAIQRIEARKHWMSDVLVGGAIGYFVASALVKLSCEARSKLKSRTAGKHVGSNSDRLSFKPFILENSIGLSFLF